MESLEAWPEMWRVDYRQMMTRKLGLNANGSRPSHEDQLLIKDLMKLLQDIDIDMTLFFRGLARISLHQPPDRILHTLTPS